MPLSESDIGWLRDAARYIASLYWKPTVLLPGKRDVTCEQCSRVIAGREDGTGEPCYISDGGDAHLCESCYAACDERELEYLQGEIDYDRSLEWKRTVLSEKENHQHCNICFRAIPAFGQIADRVCYAAEGEYGYLCQECYLRFIKK